MVLREQVRVTNFGWRDFLRRLRKGVVQADDVTQDETRLQIMGNQRNLGKQGNFNFMALGLLEIPGYPEPYATNNSAQTAQKNQQACC